MTPQWQFSESVTAAVRPSTHSSSKSYNSGPRTNSPRSQGTRQLPTVLTTVSGYAPVNGYPGYSPSTRVQGTRQVPRVLSRYPWYPPGTGGTQQSAGTHQGAVALTVGLVPRRIVPELRHFHWLLKMNNQSN